MDVGVTIVFILSILCAIFISEGDILVGVIAFFVAFAILQVLKKIIESLSTTQPPLPPPPPSGKINIIFSEDQFFQRNLDMVMRFLSDYSISCGDWYHFFISQDWEHDGKYTYGYLKFEIILGSWWDACLRKDQEAEDYVKGVFDFNEKELKFTYKMRTGDSCDCTFPREEINKMLQKYLDHYEEKHPHVHFERASYGAKISGNL